MIKLLISTPWGGNFTFQRCKIWCVEEQDQSWSVEEEYDVGSPGKLIGGV